MRRDQDRDHSCQHQYADEVTAPTCTEKGFTTHTCTICGDSYTDSETAAIGHSYVDGTCENCGAIEPTTPVDYYLIGYINGANYGCDSDYENLGEYKFVDGKVAVRFSSDSYVFIKTATMPTGS